MAAEAAEDTFEADLEAMRDEPEADTPRGDGDDGAAPDGDGEQAPPQDRTAFLEGRLSDLNKALKSERRARQALEQRVQPPPQRQVAPSYVEGMPDPDHDPIGAIAHLRGVVERMEAAQRGETEQDQRTQAHRAAAMGVVQTMQSYEADFAEDHPDYGQAAQHFANSYRDELSAQGWSGAQLDQKLAEDWLGLVSRAVQGGRDPAEIVYGLAQRRGYTPGQAQQRATSAAARPNIKPVDQAAQRVEQIARGQQQSGALSRGGNQTSGSALTADAIVKLEGAAFDSAFEKYRRQEKRAGR